MATSYKTPGVFFTEKDISEVIAGSGNIRAGMVIASKKGPINRRVTISSVKDYLAVFGAPVADTLGSSKVLTWGYNSYAALAHLQGGGSAEIIRSCTAADLFPLSGISSTATTSANIFIAVTGGIPCSSAYTTEDKYDYITAVETNYGTAFSSATSANVGAVFSLQGPGVNTDKYSVGIQSFSTSADWRYSYDTYTNGITSATTPGSDGSKDLNGNPLIATQVVKVSVYSTVGGTTPVEVFYGSFSQELVINGVSAYLPDVINGKSSTGLYCKVVTNTISGALNTSAVMTLWQTERTSLLAGGASTNSAAQSIAAMYDYFDTSDLAYLVDANEEQSVYSADTKIAEMITLKGNLLGITQSKGTVDVAIANKATYVSAIKAATSYYNDSYGTRYTGFKQINDVYNAKKIYLPNAVSACYTNVLTDTIANVWDAPAGEGRGNVACIDQAPNLNDTDIGNLYDLGYNCVKKFPGQGFIIWGQKTAQRKKSALDRINTRKTLNIIKKSIADSVKSLVLTTNNTPGVRMRTQNNINDYLAGIVASGGLTAGTCICDDSNNTPQTIDNHILVIDVVIQPVQTIEFIQVNITITRTGVSVSEALVA